VIETLAQAKQYGLTQAQLKLIIDIFQQFPAIERAVLFGSRAKGTMHNRSDLDLAVSGKLLDRHALAQLAMVFDESDLPYAVDVQILQDIQSSALRDHIQRIGKVIYQQS
jgi:predicted nucleotidyltransferase